VQPPGTDAAAVLRDWAAARPPPPGGQ